MIQRKYGWKPSLPDHRHKLFSDIKVEKKELPPKVDLLAKCSLVEDQGNLGSCTANALAGALEYNEMKTQKFIDLSRLFIYYNERMLEGTINQDSGAMLTDGIKSLVKYGVCMESIVKYDITTFKMKPSPAAYKDAATRKISSYYKLENLMDMKLALANGYPFVLGFSVYESFESPTVARTGILNIPKDNESLMGGHAVCAVGYDDATGRFLIRNSWGTKWGKSGYFTMPYSYISHPQLANDMWVIKK